MTVLLPMGFSVFICAVIVDTQISIWEERKVFGSRGQILKDEFVGRQPDTSNRNGKPTGLKLVIFF